MEDGGCKTYGMNIYRDRQLHGSQDLGLSDGMRRDKIVDLDPGCVGDRTSRTSVVPSSVGLGPRSRDVRSGRGDGRTDPRRTRWERPSHL